MVGAFAEGIVIEGYEVFLHDWGLAMEASRCEELCKMVSEDVKEAAHGTDLVIV
jgi:hypothetical protein